MYILLKGRGGDIVRNLVQNSLQSLQGYEQALAVMKLAIIITTLQTLQSLQELNGKEANI